MDASLVQQMIERNRPFDIKTAAGDTYHVPHRDFISFSSKKTTVYVSYVEHENQRLAYIPLLTITALEGEQEPAAQ